MRKFFLIFAIPIFAFVLACASQPKNTNTSANAAPAAAPAATPEDNAARISLADAKKAFDDGSAIFVDSRAESAYKDEHIKGAINITHDTLEARLKDLPKDKKIIVYCS
jgi:predicted sulfurtransferase